MSRDLMPESFVGREARDTTSERDRTAPEESLNDSRASVENSPSREHESDPRNATHRSIFYDRDQGYEVSPEGLHLLAELGRFRVIAKDDLVRSLSSGSRETLSTNISALLRQGLVRQGNFAGPESTSRVLLTLTKRGHRLLRANKLVPDGQATYYGFVKPREANHDANIYRLYQKEAARIEKKGGRIRRVVLDFEIKRKINRDTARLGEAARPAIAQKHGLRVVGTKIPVPDLRVEYETRDGETARVNLELVTEHYRGQSLGEKALAGFVLYTLRGEGDKLRRVLDQHELTAEILSL